MASARRATLRVILAREVMRQMGESNLTRKGLSKSQRARALGPPALVAAKSMIRSTGASCSFRYRVTSPPSACSTVPVT
jgi:hypothetical protein